MTDNQENINEIQSAFALDNLKSDRIMLYLIALHWFISSAVTSIQYGTFLFGFLSGGIIFLLTLLAYRRYRGQKEFDIIIGIALMLFSTVFIQQHLGRIEMHFHIFVAIAFLTIYKTHHGLVAAVVTTTLHHFLFNYLQMHEITLFGNPIYIFNYGCGYDIVLLHTVFVLFEASVIFYFINNANKHYIKLILAEQKYKDITENLEHTVEKRTAELKQLNSVFNEAQQITHLGNWEWNIEDNSLNWSDEIYRIFGLEPRSTLPTYDKFISFVHPDDRETINTNIDKALKEHTPYSVIHRIITHDNVLKYVQERGHAKYDQNHTPIQMIGTVQDITSEVKAQEELKRSEDKFKVLTENSYTGIFVHKNKILYTNPQFEKMTGYSSQELKRMDLLDIFMLEENKEELASILKRRRKGEAFTTEYENIQMRCKDGSIKFVNAYSMTIEYEGEFVALSNIFDVTDTKKTSEQLQALSQIAEQTDDIIKMTDPEGILTYVNDAFVAHSGYMRHEIIGKRSNFMKSGKHDKKFYENLWSTITQGHPFKDLFINRKKDGSLYYEQETITPIVNEMNQITAYVSTGKDISERIEMEKRLALLASTDTLTGIYNRRKFEEIFATELARTKRHSNPLALIMLDIDHFKAINDTYGHDIGDHVIKSVVDVIQFNLRSTDVFARWGGEEFIILAPETTEEQVKVLGEKLRHAIEEYDFGDAGKVTASFGLSVNTKDASSAQMIKQADDAMYKAKQNGRNMVVFNA